MLYVTCHRQIIKSYNFWWKINNNNNKKHLRDKCQITILWLVNTIYKPINNNVELIMVVCIDKTIKLSNSLFSFIVLWYNNLNNKDKHKTILFNKNIIPLM